jgi:hypothetical protein
LDLVERLKVANGDPDGQKCHDSANTARHAPRTLLNAHQMALSYAAGMTCHSNHRLAFAVDRPRWRDLAKYFASAGVEAIGMALVEGQANCVDYRLTGDAWRARGGEEV